MSSFVLKTQKRHLYN